MDEPDRIVAASTAVVWIGAGLLFYAGLSWLRLYKRIAVLRSRGGGSGIDAEQLQEAALFTGLGLVGTVAGLALHFLL